MFLFALRADNRISISNEANNKENNLIRKRKVAQEALSAPTINIYTFTSLIRIRYRGFYSLKCSPQSAVWLLRRAALEKLFFLTFVLLSLVRFSITFYGVCVCATSTRRTQRLKTEDINAIN